MDLFERHYHQHFDYVYRYCHFRLADPQAAEDVTSKTFLKAFENQNQYDPEKGNWKQWVTGIARHQILDYWKREKIPLSLEDLEKAEHLLHTTQHPSNGLDSKLMLESMLRTIPANVHHLLILRYVDDMTYEDIAESTGKTPSAIRKLFSRLHKSLRSQLGNHNLTS